MKNGLSEEILASGAVQEADQGHRDGVCNLAAEFLDLWNSGVTETAVVKRLEYLLAKRTLCGRIIHGKDDGAFVRLSVQPWKRLSWVFGPDALRTFLGKDARGICMTVGFGDEWLDAKLQAGVKFKLAVFPTDVDTFGCERATWDGLESMVSRAYPEVAEKVTARMPQIRSESFRELQSQAGYDMLEVNLKGREVDTRYVSAARLQQREGNVTEVRQFLFDECGVRNLFTGDGYTVDDAGIKGVAEYLAINRALAEIPGCVSVDLKL
eukprot:gene19303-23076_t